MLVYINSSISNNSVKHNRTLSGATTLGPSVPGSDVNKGVVRISRRSSITGSSISDWLVSYQDTLWGSLNPLQRCSQPLKIAVSYILFLLYHVFLLHYPFFFSKLFFILYQCHFLFLIFFLYPFFLLIFSFILCWYFCHSLIARGCRKCRLYFCGVVKHSNECLRLDTKSSDGDTLSCDFHHYYSQVHSETEKCLYLKPSVCK